MVNVKKIFKRFGAIAMSSVMAVSLTACGGSDSGASAGSGAADGDALPKEIRIGYWATPNAELLVKETGALEELYPDVEVTWIEFTSGADILTAMQAGSIDFSTIGTPPGTTGIANDYPFSVYYLEDIIGEMEGLIVKEDSGINSLADLKGNSGGMRQRATIARTLAPDPRIVLLDEPFSALDALTREHLQQHIYDIWRKTKKSFLFITHDVDEALILSNRILVMQPNPGHLTADLENHLDKSKAGFFRTIRETDEFWSMREYLIDQITTKEGRSASEKCLKDLKTVLN